MLADGNKAPDFELPCDDGTVIRLSRQRGQVTVLYFYPKDDTSGCTAQAKDFSCMTEQFKAAGAEVIGVSPDAIESHLKFRKKHDLSVRLGADADRKVAVAYGVWVEKSMYGKKYMGVERSTFLIDKTGRIAKAWHKVKVPGHAGEVLEAVKALKT
jgi:thioredoxin-dependent peroxiredoxin